MTGLRKRIKNHIPQSWEYVLRKRKKLTKFIELVYKAMPVYTKGSKLVDGKIGYRRGILYITNIFRDRNNILLCLLEKDITKEWQNIQKEIYEYQNNLK